MKPRWPPEKKLWTLLFALLIALGFAFQAWLKAKFLDDIQAGQVAQTQVAALIANTVSIELNAGRYQNLEGLLKQWTSSNGSIVSLEVRAANGFVLASIHRPSIARHVLAKDILVTYSYQGQARVLVQMSLDDLYDNEIAFIQRVVAVFLCFTLLVFALTFFAIRSKKEALQAQQITKLYNALSEINQAIVRIEQEDQLFPMICRSAVEYGGLSMAWVAKVDDMTHLFYPVAQHGTDMGYLEQVRVSPLADVPEGQGPIGITYRENRTVIVNNIADAPIMIPWRSPLGKTNWKSLASFPIPRGGQPFAVLSVYHTEPNVFDPRTMTLLDEMARDVSFALDNFDKETHIHFLAYHDNLTGLPNRQLARDHFDIAQSYADRSNSKMGIIFLDLDDFKSINDSLGHNVGDELLKVTSTRLSEILRGTDTLSRQGGDEFLILLADLPDEEAITEVAEKLLKEMEAPFEIDGHRLSLSTSIGIAIYPDDGRDFNALLKRADTAMYQAKAAGKNTYRFFTEQMNVDALEQIRMRAHLRHAIENSEFILHYQPQIDLASGRVVGAEALIRWNHPELGPIPPARFIPAAEESGLIAPLGDWILLEACRQAAAWCEAGLPLMTIAINISATQFKHHNLDKSVLQAIADSGVDPSCLELELTESVLITDAQVVLTTIESLKARGINLSIDDFGTGYSSLSYLKRLNVDKLKIDQSFVKDMTTSENDAAIVKAIIQMAKALNLETVAEGVESEQTMEMLRAYGCNLAQGYYFAKPLPADEFRKIVSSWPTTASTY